MMPDGVVDQMLVTLLIGGGAGTPGSGVTLPGAWGKTMLEPGLVCQLETLGVTS